MAKFLAGVLSVIAVGVLLIAYGLLGPGAAAYRDPAPAARPLYASEQLPVAVDPNTVRYAPAAPYNPVASVPPVYANSPAPAQPYTLVNYAPSQTPAGVLPMATALASPVPQRAVTRTIERPGRNWGKTALVVGGSTAAGAGLGGLFGGKKGALIGAAIGGGASTLFESTRK